MKKHMGGDAQAYNHADCDTGVYSADKQQSELYDGFEAEPKEGARRLDVELVRRGVAATRSRAIQLIKAGAVCVNGKVQRKAGFAVKDADLIELDAGFKDFAGSVGRGALKLKRALEYWSLKPAGICLDIGASTGGFTQVLLENGAERVIAVDVGRNQLSEVLRADERVVSLEKTDVRALGRDDLARYVPGGGSTVCGEGTDGAVECGGGIYGSAERTGTGGADFVVCDVSFISLTRIVGAIYALAASGAHIVLLVKPQFELEAKRRMKNGVVKSAGDREGAVRRVVSAAEATGLRFVGMIESPVRGGSGNIEYFAYFVKE